MSSPLVLPGLARMVRGLSAIFWSLPMVLLLDAKMATDPTWHSFGILPSVVSSGLLVYGLRQLRFYQSQERIWINSIERAEIFAWLVLGLSPFPLWWNRSPDLEFFSRTVVVLVFSGLALLLALNHALFRLSLMIPDETVRMETRLFSQINRGLLIAHALVLAFYLLLLRQPRELPESLHSLLSGIEAGKSWLILLLALVPVALTMTLIWKAKDVILTGVFQPRRDP